MDPSCVIARMINAQFLRIRPTPQVLKCFVTNEDFGQGGVNMENFITFRVVNVIQHLQKRPM